MPLYIYVLGSKKNHCFFRYVFEMNQKRYRLDVCLGAYMRELLNSVVELKCRSLVGCDGSLLIGRRQVKMSGDSPRNQFDDTSSLSGGTFEALMNIPLLTHHIPGWLSFPQHRRYVTGFDVSTPFQPTNCPLDRDNDAKKKNVQRISSHQKIISWQT